MTGTSKQPAAHSNTSLDVFMVIILPHFVEGLSFTPSAPVFQSRRPAFTGGARFIEKPGEFAASKSGSAADCVIS
jgi:hypothetical protein